ncbi:MAG: hypothetical protein OEW22_08670, partial [Rubrivivax sp.]|nr:hypothetical protein [Rubrivivax sp.]
MKIHHRRLGVLLSLCFSTLALAETWHADPISGCTVFDSDDAATGVLISWSGDCDQDKHATGPGVLSWIEGGKLVGRFEGSMRGGKANGDGTIYVAAPQGGYDRFEGSFKDNEVAGRLSARTANGLTFEGVLSSPSYSGSGTLKTAAGDQYTGELANGQLNGPGHLMLANGEQYRGHFVANNLEGPGEWLGSKGDYYRGEFKAGVYAGKGR